MAADKSPTDAADATLRSVLSVVIFIHLFCVAVVLSSNLRRSALQDRLVSMFAPYTEALHFDPDFTPYYYTFGRQLDDDATFEIDLYADAEKPVTAQPLLATVRLPEGGTNWFGDRRRHFALGKVLAYNADPAIDRDELTGEIARSVGTRILRETAARRGVLRCVHRMSQPRNLSLLNPGFPPDDPTADAYREVAYEADVWFDEDNQVQVLKRAARAEVAPRQTAPSTSAPRSGSSAPRPEASNTRPSAP